MSDVNPNDVDEQNVNNHEEVQFDWLIYVDATLAGLAVLIPVPFVDSLFERFFRRRMIHTIAARRDQTLPPWLVQLVNRERFDVVDAVWGCLFFPARFLIDLILRLSRKILYFLTVERAVNALSYYWQRAFLLDHMLRAGYATNEARATVAVATLDRLLDEVGVSPLRRLARRVVFNPFRVLRALWRVRRAQDDETIQQVEESMARNWNLFGAYLTNLARRYDRLVAADLAAAPEKTPPQQEKPV